LISCFSKGLADSPLILLQDGNRLADIKRFRLDECLWLLVRLEVDEVVVSAGEVDAGYLRWVEAFWVQAEDSVQIGVHGLWLGDFLVGRFAGRGAHDTRDSGASTTDASC